MNYDIRDSDLTRSLPLPLHEDKTELAIAKAVSEQLIITANLAEKAVLYARIDELDENILDTLAVDMHVDWYDPDAHIRVKRELIKTSVKVHKKLGTPWAVEQVVSAYYNDGYITEWFEYGGEPGYFRIIVHHEEPSSDKIRLLVKQIEKIKRKSAWLEGITFTLEIPASVYVAASSFHAVSESLPTVLFDISTPQRANVHIAPSVFGSISDALNADFEIKPKTNATVSVSASVFGGVSEVLSAYIDVPPKFQATAAVKGSVSGAISETLAAYIDVSE